MVLAAGAGRRLRPDTDALPKALLPVDGRVTILDIALRNLAAVGLRDIVIVVGYAADAVRDRLAGLEREHGVRLTLVDNDRAEEWNNAYSLWLAREHFAAGALLVNGDTVHPVSVEKTLLAAGQGSAGHGAAAAPQPGIIIAVDDIKRLADEEMKVIIDSDGRLTRITKLMDPALAYGEYIGATLIDASAAALARGGPRGDVAPGSLAVLRGRFPGTHGPRRRDRGGAHRRGRVGGGRQPRRPAPGSRDRRSLLMASAERPCCRS